jgi:hypothetical protein
LNSPSSSSHLKAFIPKAKTTLANCWLHPNITPRTQPLAILDLILGVDGENVINLYTQNTISSLNFKGRITCHEHIFINNKFHLYFGSMFLQEMTK